MIKSVQQDLFAEAKPTFITNRFKETLYLSKPSASLWTLTQDLLQIDEVAERIPAKIAANGNCLELLF